MNKIVEELSKIGIVPVIAIDDAADAVPLAKALIAGGLPCAEITFRTAAAEESIRLMAEACPDMLVGAGTVLTTEQVDKAINAGSKFIVSPGLNPEIVKYCQSKGVPVLPGCSNPSDIEMALSLGLTEVKFFPAEAAGGLNMIKAMSAPYGNVKFMPTGGINAKNLTDYLDFDKILACGGTYMVTKDMIANKEFDKIEQLTREAVKAMLGFDIRHVGINAENEEEAIGIATLIANMFGFPVKNGNSSVFAGTAVEVMKEKYLGTHGHIAIGTRYIERAIYHLERQGVVFDYDTVKTDVKGKKTAIYMKGEFGGFALHLVQNK